MALKFYCPHCNSPIIVRFLKAGEDVRCKSCEKTSIVPEDGEVVNDEEANIFVKKNTKLVAREPSIEGKQYSGIFELSLYQAIELRLLGGLAGLGLLVSFIYFVFFSSIEFGFSDFVLNRDTILGLLFLAAWALFGILLTAIGFTALGGRKKVGINLDGIRLTDSRIEMGHIHEPTRDFKYLQAENQEGLVKPMWSGQSVHDGCSLDIEITLKTDKEFGRDYLNISSIQFLNKSSLIGSVNNSRYFWSGVGGSPSENDLAIVMDGKIYWMYGERGITKDTYQTINTELLEHLKALGELLSRFKYIKPENCTIVFSAVETGKALPIFGGGLVGYLAAATIDGLRQKLLDGKLKKGIIINEEFTHDFLTLVEKYGWNLKLPES